MDISGVTNIHVQVFPFSLLLGKYLGVKLGKISKSEIAGS